MLPNDIYIKILRYVGLQRLLVSLEEESPLLSVPSCSVLKGARQSDSSQPELCL